MATTEVHSNLMYLDTNGRPFNVDSILLSNDEFEGVQVVTSDDRMAMIIGVQRHVVGCAAANNSVSVSFTVKLEPLSEPLSDLFTNLQLARRCVDAWQRSFTQQNKAIPKRKGELANLMLWDMSMNSEVYEEMRTDGIAAFLASNLDCDIALFPTDEMKE